MLQHIQINKPIIALKPKRMPRNKVCKSDNDKVDQMSPLSGSIQIKEITYSILHTQHIFYIFTCQNVCPILFDK